MTKNKQIIFRLTTTEREAVESVAIKMGCSLSEAIRTLINNSLKAA